MKLIKTVIVSLVLVTAGGAAFAQSGAEPQLPAKPPMAMSASDQQMMSSCMGMKSSAMKKNAECTSMMKKMNISNADMKKMMSCRSMSSAMMMKDKKCMTMKTMHPDTMAMPASSKS